MLFEGMSKGWAMGSREFKQALVKDERSLRACLELGVDDARADARGGMGEPARAVPGRVGEERRRRRGGREVGGLEGGGVRPPQGVDAVPQRLAGPAAEHGHRVLGEPLRFGDAFGTEGSRPKAFGRVGRKSKGFTHFGCLRSPLIF